MSRSLVDRLAGAVLAVAVAITLAVPAAASFVRTSSASQQVDTAVLQPPTLLVASNGLCVRNKSMAVVLTWTPTPSTAATGYEVLRDGAVIGTVGKRLANTYTDTTADFSTAYSYSVRSVRNYWRSEPSTPAAVTTLSKVCR